MKQWGAVGLVANWELRNLLAAFKNKHSNTISNKQQQQQQTHCADLTKPVCPGSMKTQLLLFNNILNNSH